MKALLSLLCLASALCVLCADDFDPTFYGSLATTVVPNPTPGFTFIATQTVNSTSQYVTNTITTSGTNGLIRVIWHIYYSGIAHTTNYANGQLMTQLSETNGYNGDYFAFGIAYIVPNSNGVWKIGCNGGSTPLEKTVLVEYFTNVNQSVPFGTFVADASPTPPNRTGCTNTVTSAANDLIVDAVGWATLSVSRTFGPGQSLVDVGEFSGNASIISSSKPSSGATTTMSWVNFASGPIDWIGCALKGP